jgi:hypothetical protein
MPLTEGLKGIVKAVLGLGDSTNGRAALIAATSPPAT